MAWWRLLWRVAVIAVVTWYLRPRRWRWKGPGK